METAIDWLIDITYKSELIPDILEYLDTNKMSGINSRI